MWRDGGYLRGQRWRKDKGVWDDKWLDAVAWPSLRVERHRSGATKEWRGQAAEPAAVIAVDLASIEIELQPLANAHTPVTLLAML